MLTLLESVSLAGNRARQNDDAAGAHGPLAWVVDGATDLHEAPFSGAASDAAWLAQELNAVLTACAAGVEPSFAGLRGLVHEASDIASELFESLTGGRTVPDWARPVASALIVADAPEGLAGLDLGDCSLFVLDRLGEVHVMGGAADPDRETQSAARLQSLQPPADGQELYQTPAALEVLRQQRSDYDSSDEAQVYGLDPGCAERARTWHLQVARPAHLLLASDGFAALVDKYSLHTPQSLIRQALQTGLVSLTQELRAFETQDASSQGHPRFKRSDDATALLLRLD